MSKKSKAVIFDLDGTLADITHRLHYIKGYQTGDEQNSVDWNTFNEACVNDEPKWDIIELLDVFKTNNYKIIICTGRAGTPKVMALTKQWLKIHCIEYDAIYFRGEKDFRSDDVVKRGMLNDIKNRWTILMAIDDRQRVVEMWRKEGLTCLQCQKGDY